MFPLAFNDRLFETLEMKNKCHCIIVTHLIIWHQLVTSLPVLSLLLIGEMGGLSERFPVLGILDPSFSFI